MTKINLRDISSRAKQWDHPVKGLFKYVESMNQHNCNIFELPKKDRECYCMSIVRMALKNDSKEDWWINMPTLDPPDGLVMTFRQEAPDMFWGYLREIEIVEHRDEPNKIFEVIRNKMVKKSYEANTILVCLILTTAPVAYDFQVLSAKLAEIKSSIKHVFVVFTGSLLINGLPTKEQMSYTYSMVQLLPVMEQGQVDSRPHLEDYKERFGKGQESRIIENNEVHYGTANQKYGKRS